jgi:hypothetical protein
MSLKRIAAVGFASIGIATSDARGAYELGFPEPFVSEGNTDVISDRGGFEFDFGTGELIIDGKHANPDVAFAYQSGTGGYKHLPLSWPSLDSPRPSLDSPRPSSTGWNGSTGGPGSGTVTPQPQPQNSPPIWQPMFSAAGAYMVSQGLYYLGAGMAGVAIGVGATAFRKRKKKDLGTFLKGSREGSSDF